MGRCGFAFCSHSWTLPSMFSFILSVAHFTLGASSTQSSCPGRHSSARCTASCQGPPGSSHMEPTRLRLYSPPVSSPDHSTWNFCNWHGGRFHYGQHRYYHRHGYGDRETFMGWVDLCRWAEGGPVNRFDMPGFWDTCDWCGWWGWLEGNGPVIEKHRLVKKESEHPPMFFPKLYCLRCASLDEPPWARPRPRSRSAAA